MEYDNGDVLPRLNEPWTFAGATLIEWCMGLVVFLLISTFSETPARAMPAMIIGWVCTTISLASLRNVFPDQERGVRNAFMTSCGFTPLGIPAPASIQPVWAATPVRKLSEESQFVQLGLDKTFDMFQREFNEDDDMQEG